MTYFGRIKNGAVELDANAQLPEGTEVRVEVLRRPARPPQRRERTIYEALRKVIGKARGLPADFSENHDHYLYGLRKRKRK